MSKLLVAALSFAFLVSVGGCKHNDDMDDDMDHDHDNMKMDDDMKKNDRRSGMNENRSGSTAAGADQCSSCPGVQKLNADGTCPACKMKMKK
jgi:hypothetical protein